ncbi:uncharacterized protein LOC108108605 [Drosophila eugracilis]|uniref:uncharacterized protein LOC108108605 n=1 Tax=Drosophila eugracilis TaxID=29029 RepID=UPI0007E7682E|nr:uncharacterized protein LOC108108605 [Drosophila eugracilis]
MPFHDRAKARLEHEVVLLRNEVASLRSKLIQRRKVREEQAVHQARLEQEINVLQLELAASRCARKERERGGAEECSLLNNQLEKLDEHVVKQEKYIAFLEEQINQVRNKYHERMIDVRKNAELVEKELKRVRCEMKTIAEQAGEMDHVQQQVGFLSAKLERRNSIIAKYESQQEEMMAVMARLQKHYDKTKGRRADTGHHRKRTSSKKDKAELIAPDEPPVHKEKYKSSKSKQLNFVCLSSALKNKLNTQKDVTADH